MHGPSEATCAALPACLHSLLTISAERTLGWAAGVHVCKHLLMLPRTQLASDGVLQPPGLCRNLTEARRLPCESICLVHGQCMEALRQGHQLLKGWNVTGQIRSWGEATPPAGRGQAWPAPVSAGLLWIAETFAQPLRAPAHRSLARQHPCKHLRPKRKCREDLSPAPAETHR